MKNVRYLNDFMGCRTVNVAAGALCGFFLEWIILIFLPGWLLQHDKTFTFGVALLATLLNGFISAWMSYVIVIILRGRDRSWIFKSSVSRCINLYERSAGWFLGVAVGIVMWVDWVS